MKEEGMNPAYAEFCADILGMDKAIRFVGVTNAMGSLLATRYRPGVVPFMNPQETANYALKAAIRAATRDDFESNVGDTLYVIARYAKLVRATLTIGSHEKKHLLLVSFDVDSDPESIITKKIIPYIGRKKDVLS
jgi:hypothetical protein